MLCNKFIVLAELITDFDKTAFIYINMYRKIGMRKTNHLSESSFS